MHVWLIGPYGALPGESWREYRAVLIARALVAAGHTVTWWVASFDHRTRSFRSADWEQRSYFPGFDAVLVPTTGYQRAMSLGRIRFEQTFARRIAEEPHRSRRPDLVVLGEPALFTSAPIVALTRAWNVPLMLDIGDLWPELFSIALPRPLRPLARVIFAPLHRRRAALARYASGYVAATRDYLALFQSLAPHEAAAVVYLGIDVAGLRAEMTADVELPLEVSSRKKAPSDFWAVYAGSLGPNYDIGTIVAAAERLRANPAITIFIAGEGDGASRDALERDLRSRALTNCIFLGALAPAIVARLYGVCDAALSSYVADSTVSMPVKAFDYFAAGLPVVNSLGRDLGDFITSRRAGLQYEPASAESLAKALSILASDVELRRTMAANAARLGAEFDWREQYAPYVAVAEQLVAGSTSREQASMLAAHA